MDNNTTLLEVNSLYKTYDKALVKALNGLTFSLKKGKIYAIMGSSGCGKSTLLNLIGTLDNADSGKILYEGKEIDKFKDISLFRREYIGFVFQFHYLIPVLTLKENIETAMLLNKHYTPQQREQRAIKLLKQMGLDDKIDARANKVSGGQRQRAAIARAMANNPKLILADEPTGNVDSQTSAMILKHLKEYVKRLNTTMLIATHDPNVAAIADETFYMQDGQIVDKV